jgi:uncharacterized protein YjbI with pentapeptide repeats
MIVPERALVRPRVLSADSGGSLLVEDVLQDLLDRRPRGSLRVVGPAGSGKTTALRHLAHVFAGSNVIFVDEPAPSAAIPPSSHWFVFTTAHFGGSTESTETLVLAPWREDEWIEYLLAAHPDRCRSVMARLRADTDVATFLGIPQLSRRILDLLAADEAIPTIRAALLGYCDRFLTSQRLSETARKCAFDSLVTSSLEPTIAAPLNLLGEELLLKLLRHRPIQLLLAEIHVVDRLLKKGKYEALQSRLPRDLIEQVAKDAARQPEVREILRKCLADPADTHAMAASILHAAGAKWFPRRPSKLKLSGAYLSGIDWSGLSLSDIDVSEADLNSADLRNANLDGARAFRTNLSRANLAGASLAKIHASQAVLAQSSLSGCNISSGVLDGSDLAKADLQDADLRGATFTSANFSLACLRKADLRKAQLVGATLDDADFSEADLSEAILTGLDLRPATFTRARFRGAFMSKCNLEEMDLPRADFKAAKLHGALLTGSQMPGACFDGALLTDAGLADVDWEGASLRGAILTGASFHLGSSRSGLVGSPIACEGSRTGFYTDDFTEQDFKAPEEIRKANLCHADLRGARIVDVDFYLVDLRHARLDPEQIDHLRRCGAILEDRRKQAEE